MTLFNNPNFLDHILRGQGVEHQIEEIQIAYIQTLIQLQTRQLIETALKFMRRDRRDTLSLQDIQLAAKQNLHSEMSLSGHCDYHSENQQIIKQDKIFGSAIDVLKQQLTAVGGRHVEGPRLQGRWILVKGRIPSLSQNANLKKLDQLTQNQKHQRQQKKKVFNVIKDQPYSLMTKQQRQFFIKMCQLVSSNGCPNGQITLQGNLNDLMPFFLKFFGEAQLNQTAISLLLKLIQNKYIWRAIEYHLTKVLCLLIAYKGPRSYDVGVKLGQITNKFSDKYVHLRDIFEGYTDNSYSTIMKKIPFEILTGVQLKLDQQTVSKCKLDAQNNNEMAILCMKALLSNSSQLLAFKKYLKSEFNTFIYWHPSQQLKKDPFLNLF